MVAIKIAIEPYGKKKAKERELAGKPLEKFSKDRALDHIVGFVGISRPPLKKSRDIITTAEEPEKRVRKNR